MMYNLILHDMLACIETDTLQAFNKVNSENSLRVEFKRYHEELGQTVFVNFDLAHITVTCWDRLAVLNSIRFNLADPHVFEKVKSMIECFLDARSDE